MVLFHETRHPRGSNSDNTAPPSTTAAAAVKELDVEAMITDIIIEKVLQDPASPDKGERTTCVILITLLLLQIFSRSRTHAFDGLGEPWYRQETLELDGPGHAQGVLRHEDFPGEPLGHPRAPQEAAHLRIQAPVHSRRRVEPGTRLIVFGR